MNDAVKMVSTVVAITCFLQQKAQLVPQMRVIVEVKGEYGSHTLRFILATSPIVLL